MKTPISILILLVALLQVEKDVLAQAQNKCFSISYSAPLASARSYRFKSVEGQTVYASPQQRWESGPSGGVCVVVFDPKSKSQITNAITDDKGQFGFDELPPGEYALVASAGELQPISIPVQISPDVPTSGRLLLHLREAQDPRKSYVTVVAKDGLRKELISMLEEDQKIRREIIENGVEHPSEQLQSRMDTIDRKNTMRMKSIVKQYGWPTSDMVGWDGSDAAFLLVQHADHDSHKTFVPLLQKEFKAGNVSGPNYALFVDRVLTEEGKLQIYGSRTLPFDRWQDGEPALYPIEDEANVDKRRAEVGLSPLSEYREMLKQMYHPGKRNE